MNIEGEDVRQRVRRPENRLVVLELRQEDLLDSLQSLLPLV